MSVLRQRESVSRKRGAIKALWSGSLAKELDATGMVPLLNKDRTFGEGVMREMIEPRQHRQQGHAHLRRHLLALP